MDGERVRHMGRERSRQSEEANGLLVLPLVSFIPREQSVSVSPCGAEGMIDSGDEGGEEEGGGDEAYLSRALWALPLLHQHLIFQS